MEFCIRQSIASMLALAALQLCSHAHAQDATVQVQVQTQATPQPYGGVQPYPAVQPYPTQPPQPYGAQPYVQPYGQPQLAPPSAYQALAPSEDGVRFRWGIDVGAGTTLGESIGGAFNLVGARLGIQINDLLAVYYQPRLVLALGKSSDSLSLSYGIYNAAMVDITLWNILNLGGGISLDYGMFGKFSKDDGSSDVSSTDLAFGLDFRAAVMFGGERDQYGRRRGFTLNLDAHPTIVDTNAIVTTLILSLGYESY